MHGLRRGRRVACRYMLLPSAIRDGFVMVGFVEVEAVYRWA